MTHIEFAKQMEFIAKGAHNDPEAAHCAADDLMCSLLRELGHGVAVDMFLAMEKWYA